MGNYTNHTIETKLSELVFHYHQAGLYHQLLCQNLLMQILLHLTKMNKELTLTVKKKEDANKAKLILARNFITSHLREGFHHTELEKLTGWSRNYIISQFREAFGMSPVQYLVWIRLEKPKN